MSDTNYPLLLAPAILVTVVGAECGLKDGGHVNLGVIVMGQSANVSTSKGLSIDDQKMLTNIYIDPVSIRTFLTQYGERFYSKRTVEKALYTLEELELELEEKNDLS